eukprot:gene44322-10496_t
MFVYGTLRPDDDSGAAWTEPFCEGMEALPARVKGLRLYLDRLQTKWWARPGARLMTCRDDDESWAEKCAMADRIEGYPEFYSRAVVEAVPREGDGAPDFPDPVSGAS